MDKRVAFTLIELLVVIAVIGILSGLIVVSMSGTSQKATIAKGQIFSNSLRNSLMSNVVAEWRFENNLVDSWSGINNGTWHGADSGANTAVNYHPSTECIYGSCIHLDGSDDYVDYGNPSSLNFGTSNFTLSAWIQTTSTSTNMMIVSKGSMNAAYNQGRYAIRVLNGYLDLFVAKNEVSSPSSSITDTIVPLRDGKWHYVVGIRNVNFIKIYVDGAYRGQTDTITAYNTSNDLSVWVGTMYSTVSLIYTSMFNGLIDEVRIYDEAATVSQIKENYFIGVNNLFRSAKITQKEYLSRINEYANK